LGFHQVIQQVILAERGRCDERKEEEENIFHVNAFGCYKDTN